MYVVVSFHGCFDAWLGGQAFFFLYLFTVFAKTKVNKNEQIKKKEVEMRSRTEQLDRVKNLLEENLEELKKMQEAELETAKR